MGLVSLKQKPSLKFPSSSTPPLKEDPTEVCGARLEIERISAIFDMSSLLEEDIIIESELRVAQKRWLSGTLIGPRLSTSVRSGALPSVN